MIYLLYDSSDRVFKFRAAIWGYQYLCAFAIFFVCFIVTFDKLCAFRFDTCQRLSAHCKTTRNIEAVF